MTLTKHIRVTETGKSLRIVLPKEWTKQEGITKKDEIIVIVGGGILALLPKHQLRESEIDDAFKTLRQLIQSIYRDRMAREQGPRRLEII